MTDPTHGGHPPGPGREPEDSFREEQSRRIHRRFRGHLSLSIVTVSLALLVWAFSRVAACGSSGANATLSSLLCGGGPGLWALILATVWLGALHIHHPVAASGERWFQHLAPHRLPFGRQGGTRFYPGGFRSKAYAEGYGHLHAHTQETLGFTRWWLAVVMATMAFVTVLLPNRWVDRQVGALIERVTRPASR